MTGGFLEKIIHGKHPARTNLIWQNAYFGRRGRQSVKIPFWRSGNNSPLYLNPAMLDEVLKYVFLPKDIIAAYRNHRSS